MVSIGGGGGKAVFKNAKLNAADGNLGKNKVWLIANRYTRDDSREKVEKNHEIV